MTVQPVTNIMRAPVDNDGFKLMPRLRESLGVGGPCEKRWREQGVLTMPAERLISATCEHDVVHGIDRFTHTFDVPRELDDLPRVGVRFEVDKGYTHWRYFGRGPHENYPDRRASTVLRVHGGEHGVPFDEMPYVVPQEFGLRMDCRWIELVNPRNNRRMTIRALPGHTFHASVTWHTPEQLYWAADVTELPRNANPVVCLDAAHRGLGTASCGPDVLAQYVVRSGEYHLTYEVFES